MTPVRMRRLAVVLVLSGTGGGDGSGTTEIQERVAANCTALTVGGQTVHDLTQPLTPATTG